MPALEIKDRWSFLFSGPIIRLVEKVEFDVRKLRKRKPFLKWSRSTCPGVYYLAR